MSICDNCAFLVFKKARRKESNTMTIEESIKKDPSKFQAIIDTKEAAVKAAICF